MATHNIGAGQTYTTIAAWSTYIKALVTLTENEVGVLVDDANYAHSDRQDLNFSGVTLAGFTITLTAESSVRHDGTFGTGARIEATSASFDPLYTAASINIEFISFHNTGLGNNQHCIIFNDFVNIKNCIIKVDSLQSVVIALGMNGTGTVESTAVYGGTAASITNTYANVSHLYNVSVIGHAGTLVGISQDNINKDTQNCVVYGCVTSWEDAGTAAGTWNNNASDDGLLSGGINLTGNPFEVDGFTPTTGSELDGTGVDLGLTLDAASIAYSIPPPIGAYEATPSAQQITDIDTDEIVLDGQVNATFTTTGFSSEISTVQLVSGTSITNATGVTSTSGAGTFNLPDVSLYATPTVGAPLTTASNPVVARLTDA